MKYAKKHFDFELKSVTKSIKSDEVVIEGYANTSSKDRVGDVVIPSAFQKSLPTYMSNPILLVNHDWNDIGGVVQDAQITDKGLYIKARISDTREDLKTLVREGCLRTFSIGYNEIDADVDESTKTKYIKELELLEISVVSVPANTEAMFTTAIVKTEEVLAAKPEVAGKNLKDFIVTVKDAVGTSQLGDDLLINVIDYFTLKGENEVMTKEQLISALQVKSLEVAAELKQKADAAPADAAKPVDEAKPMVDEAKPADAPKPEDMMKMCMDKMDMLAQGVAQILEMMKKDEQADLVEQAQGQQEQAKPAEEAQPAAQPPAKSAEEDKTKEAVEVSEITEEKSADLSLDEVNSEIQALDAQIQALEESEGC